MSRAVRREYTPLGVVAVDVPSPWSTRVRYSIRPWFNAGGFDWLDWVAQNLGVGVSLMLWLMILSRFSPVAEMGMEIINHLIYWSLFLMVFSVIVYHASESIRKRFPRP